MQCCILWQRCLCSNGVFLLLLFTAFGRIECDAVLIFSGFRANDLLHCMLLQSKCASFLLLACIQWKRLLTAQTTRDANSTRTTNKKMLANYEFNFIEIIGAGKIYGWFSTNPKQCHCESRSRTKTDMWFPFIRICWAFWSMPNIDGIISPKKIFLFDENGPKAMDKLSI